MLLSVVMTVSRANLCDALVYFLEREEGRRDGRPEAGLGENADNENANDLERRSLARGRGDLGSTNVGDGAGDAGGGVVLLGIDGVHGGLRVPVKERHEPLDLLLGVAEDAGANLDLVSPCRKAQEEGERCEAE